MRMRTREDWEDWEDWEVGRRRGSDEEETSLARSVLTSARRYQLSNGGKWENGQMGKWASTC